MWRKIGFCIVISAIFSPVLSANFETFLSSHSGDGKNIVLSYSVENFKGESDTWKIFLIKCIVSPKISCSLSSNLEKTEIKRLEITQNIGETNVDISSYDTWLYRLCSISNNGQDCDSEKVYLLHKPAEVITKTETVYVESACECKECPEITCIYNATLSCPECVCKNEDLRILMDTMLDIINNTSDLEKATKSSSIISLNMTKITNKNQENTKELNYYILLPIIGLIGLIVLLRGF